MIVSPSCQTVQRYYQKLSVIISAYSYPDPPDSPVSVLSSRLSNSTSLPRSRSPSFTEVQQQFPEPRFTFHCSMSVSDFVYRSNLITANQSELTLCLVWYIVSSVSSLFVLYSKWPVLLLGPKHTSYKIYDIRSHQ